MEPKEIQDIIHKTKKLVLFTIQKYIDKDCISYIDDIVQEVYFRFFQAIENRNFQFKSKISTYLYTIAKNETIRINEKNRKENYKISRYFNFFDNNNTYTENSFEWIENQNSGFKKFIERNISFNSIQKEILNLFLKGYKIREISKFLNLQEGTVKSNIFRIKKKIKKYSEKENLDLKKYFY